MKKSGIKRILAGISSACIIASALPVSVSAVEQKATGINFGDADESGDININDTVLIMQSIANPDKYVLSEQGKLNADVVDNGDGVTNSDALAIQYVESKTITADIFPITSLQLDQIGNGETIDKPVADATYIHLNGTTATVEGENAEVNGSVITISHSGLFYVDGTLDDGQININIADETADSETVKIFLNGANITGKSAPAILVTNAKNTSLNLVDGTENFISDGDTAYDGDNLGSAVIEAKDDITIKGGDSGTGILNLTANTQNAIVCNNDIKFNGGVVNITTLNSTDKTDAVKGKKSVTVKDGTINIDAEGDGIKSSKGSVSITGGTTGIKAGNDAIQAETTIDISDGTVVAGGDRGLTAVTGINITGGKVVATATDNQADSTLMGGTTQGTMLFNTIACTETTDGTWKKANSFGDFSFTKKYSYVLMSDPSFKKGFEKSFQNHSNSSAVQYGIGYFKFTMTDTVTAFDNVNPSGAVPPAESTDSNYTITLSGNTFTTDAPSDVASVENNILTIKKPAVMSISGENNGGQIVVDVDKTTYPDGVVELDLVGATLTNDSVASIYVASVGDEVQIVAKKGTNNVISDGTSHTDTYTDSDGNVNQIDSAIFSRDDLKIKGSGNLTVNGNTADGIVSKNDLKIYNGNITVNAVDDGIRGKDSVTVGNDTATDYAGLKLTVNTQSGDGIKSTSTDSATEKKSYGVVTINGGTVDIKSYADGIQAEQDFVMNGGDLNIYTYQGSGFTGSGSSSSSGNTGWGGGFGGGFGGGMQDGNSNKTDISAKGIKSVGIYDTAGTTWQSGGNITINGGNITVDSSDDSLHCGGNININGGTFRLASADDALHSDHNLTLGNEGGAYDDFNIYVTKCYEGVEGENIYQHSGTVVVKADDDGYNAAGGADGSGSGNNMGWNQGGRPGGMGGSSGNNTLSITGGIAIVQSASGDHDAFDSNGGINITGGVVIANGQECLDCDGTKSITGGTVIECSSQGNGTVSANTQFTVADGSGNVVISFVTMQGMGSPSFVSGSGLKCYTGGTVLDGTDLITSDSSQTVFADGTISGGTEISAGSGSGSQGGWGGRK
ncbi:MAG: carbohydrate-binding domain-containing protein [Ruminococcus sp.]|nr:carbohydrate-binding domain-containing protein [Ruminococcus sp.]